MGVSIIDDIHSKGELQWTDEFARFLDQVHSFSLTCLVTVSELIAKFRVWLS